MVTGVGLILSVEGLKVTGRVFPEEGEILPQQLSQFPAFPPALQISELLVSTIIANSFK